MRAQYSGPSPKVGPCEVGLTYDSFGPTINGYEYCLYWWSH